MNKDRAFKPLMNILLVALFIGFAVAVYYAHDLKQKLLSIKASANATGMYVASLENKIEHLEEQLSEERKKRFTECIVPAAQAVRCINILLDREKLVNWVMRHSLKGRMYRTLAEEIVDTTLEIEGGKYALLLLAMMERESNFYIFSRSEVGAVGLGQFTKSTIRELIRRGVFKQVDDVYDPRKHIPAILEWLRVKGMKEDGSNIDAALYNYVGGNPRKSKADKVAKRYVRDIKANVGDLLFFLSTDTQPVLCRDVKIDHKAELEGDVSQYSVNTVM